MSGRRGGEEGGEERMEGRRGLAHERMLRKSREQ
jgi:hypothetical protein